MDGAVIKKIFVIIILSASVSYISADDLSEDYSIGDKFYSRQNFYISSSFETGLSGTKDYLSEKTYLYINFVLPENFNSESGQITSVLPSARIPEEITALIFCSP